MMTLVLATLVGMQDAATLEKEARKIEAEIAAYAMLDSVMPSKETLAALLKLAQDADALGAEYERKYEKLRDRQVGAFEAFRKEDAANRGFTPKVERDAAQADHGETELQKQYRDKVNAIEDKVRALLSEEQIHTLETMSPERLLSVYVRSEPADKLPDSMDYLVREIRRLDDRTYAEQKPTLGLQFAKLIGAEPKKIDNVGGFIESVFKALDEIRALPEKRLKTDVPKIVEKAKPKDESARLQDELGKMNKRKHGEIGLIGRWLTSEYAVPSMAARLGVEPARRVATGGMKDEGGEEGCKCSPCLCAPCGCGSDSAKIRELRDDIMLLNLYNGMNFTEHQLGHLIAANKSLAKVRAAAPAPKKDAAAIRDYVKLLQKTLGKVHEFKPMSMYDLRDLQGAREKSGMPKDRFLAKPGKDAGAETLKVADGLRPHLWDAQKTVIIDFAPCLIPPANLKDPVRVGQANDTSAATRAIERLRSIPKERWAEEKPALLDRILAEAQQHNGDFPAKELPKKRAALERLVEKARSLKDVDFELGKEDLAEEFSKLLDRKEEIKNRLETLTGEDEVLCQKVSAFLLHPRAQALLEGRRRQIREAPAGKTDLDAIDPADSCHDGKCAIDD